MAAWAADLLRLVGLGGLAFVVVGVPAHMCSLQSAGTVVLAVLGRGWAWQPQAEPVDDREGSRPHRFPPACAGPGGVWVPPGQEVAAAPCARCVGFPGGGRGGAPAPEFRQRAVPTPAPPCPPCAGPPVRWLVGGIPEIAVKGWYKATQDWLAEYGPVVKVLVGGVPHVLTDDPELARRAGPGAPVMPLAAGQAHCAALWESATPCGCARAHKLRCAERAVLCAGRLATCWPSRRWGCPP